MAKLIPTGAYVRVSHDEQSKHGFSIEAQKKGLQVYAKKRGFMIVEWYVDEGKTARKNKQKRKEYIRLIQDAKEGKFKMIIFKCIDRWFRDIKEYYLTQDILESKGVGWECSEEEYDTTTREGRMKLNLYLMLAQDEADKGSERISYVFQHKIRNKEAITGTQPYGFIVKKIGDYKRVVKDPNTMMIVQDIFTHFELYNSKRATLHYIQDKYNIELEYDLIGKTLKNTMYYGHYRGVDNYVYDDSYITKKRFDKIQKMLEKNVKERKNTIDYIFSGLLICSKCTNNMTGAHTNIVINKEGEKRTYINYRCNHHYVKKHCDAKGTFSEIAIEKKLLECIEEEIEQYICEYEISLKEPAQVVNQISAKDIKEEMDRLNKQWRKGRITEQEYDYEYERLEKRLEKLKIEQPKERDLTPLYEFLNSGWKNIYGTLSSVEKRALWRSIIDSIEVEIATKQFTINFI